jgi:hypothetical protein
MARLIAVHTLIHPTEENFQAMVEKVTKAVPRGFVWKQTYCDFVSHKFFCEWEAPGKEVLEQTFKDINFSFEAVYAVKLHNVDKKKFV